MILYFTGTGNSFFAAQRLAEALDDTLYSIDHAMRRGKRDHLAALHPDVATCAIYTGRIPRVVSDWLQAATFSGSRDLYFVVTCSETPWKATGYCKKLAQRMRMAFQGLGAVVMPQNYLVNYDIPSPEESERIVRAAQPKLAMLADRIRVRQDLPQEPERCFMSGLVNPIFYPLMVHAKKFRSTDACVGCNLCVKACPLNNVQLDANHHPRWGGRCTHCMGCISICPQQAIQYGDKTASRYRNWNAAYHV